MKKRQEIIVDVQGRLGNQMFQYAFAKKLQLERYRDHHIKLCFKNVYKMCNDNTNNHGWENSLKHFILSRDVEEVADERLPLTQRISSGVFAVSKRLVGYWNGDPNKYEIKQQHSLNKKGVYMMRQSRYIPIYYADHSVVYCRGRFEAHQYFDDIREQLLKDFEPIEPLIDRNKKLYDKISSSESVCVTVRQGDFNDKGNENFRVCNAKYFVNCMLEMKRKIPQCKFFVFSDDIEKTKKEINVPFEVIYESGNDPVWEKLRLMYSCKHFIISNSTFSWWAAYLCKNPDKLVYVPKEWRLGDEDCSGMYCDYMIKR